MVVAEQNYQLAIDHLFQQADNTMICELWGCCVEELFRC